MFAIFELLFWFIFTIHWWCATASVLLPFFLVLKFNEKVRNRWFSWFFVEVLGPMLDKRKDQREPPFDMLKEYLNESGRKSVPLEILEIGIGDGANLPFYPENSNLTALDMNKTFDSYFRAEQKKYPHVTYRRLIHARAEDMKDVVDDALFDVVICSFLLCSVEDPERVLAETKRVLKPGGVFVFLEHVAYPRSDWGYTLQNLISPLWVVYFDGCIPNRETGAKIRKAGFSDVRIKNICPDSNWIYIRPRIYGLAVK